VKNLALVLIALSVLLIAPVTRVPTSPQIAINTFDECLASGNTYSVDFIDATVTDTSFSELRFTTGTSAAAIIISFDTVGNYDLQLFEDATITVGGALTEFNLDRRSSNTSLTAVTSNPTVSATGSTIIIDKRVDAGEKNAAQPVSGLSFPRILKASTEYLIRTTNQSGSTTFVSWTVSYCEIK